MIVLTWSLKIAFANTLSSLADDSRVGGPVAQCSSDITTNVITTDGARGYHESADQFDGVVWMQTRLDTVQTTHLSNSQSLGKAEEPSQQKVDPEEKIGKTLDIVQQEMTQIHKAVSNQGDQLGQMQKEQAPSGNGQFPAL